MGITCILKYRKLYVCECVYNFKCAWRSDVDIGSLPQSLVTTFCFWENGSFCTRHSRVQRYQPVMDSSDLPVSVSLAVGNESYHHFPFLCRSWRTQLGSSAWRALYELIHLSICWDRKFWRKWKHIFERTHLGCQSCYKLFLSLSRLTYLLRKVKSIIISFVC